MPYDRGMRPPLLCRWLIRVASWMVPHRARSEWLARWESGLRNWWILVERGELTGAASRELVYHCRGAFLDAFWLRAGRDQMRHWTRSASFVLMAGSVVLLAITLLSRGFAVTRSVIRMAQALPPPRPETYDQSSDMVVMYTVPIVFALATAVVLIAIGRLSLRRYSWRYWTFLVLKTMLAMVSAALIWIEGGAALRAHIENWQIRAIGGGIVFTLLFLAVFGYAVMWCLADQRQRCPVCLRRLAMPVRMGSWASIFEPPTTEFFCDEGHGTLAMSDSRQEPDRWTALDDSWRGLFEEARKR